MPPTTLTARDRVLRNIHAHGYKRGDLLPPVQTMADQHGVTVYQMRKTLRDLSERGVLKLTQRRGTVVIRPTPVRRVVILPPTDVHSYDMVVPPLCRRLTDGGDSVEVAPPGLSLESTRKLLERWHGQWDGEATLVMVEKGWVLDPAATTAGWELVRRHFPTFIYYTLEPYQPTGGGCHVIGPNYQDMARLVVDHLWSLGHRTIAVSGGWDNPAGVDMSYLWFSSEHARHLIEVLGGKCVITDRFALADSEDETRRLFKTEKATALWAMNDYAAQRVLGTCLKLGIRVPQDVSLVGRHDTSWSRNLFLPLTSVSPDGDELAEAIIRTIDTSKQPATPLREELSPNSTQGPLSRTLVKPKLYARASTVPPPASKTRHSKA